MTKIKRAPAAAAADIALSADDTVPIVDLSGINLSPLLANINEEIAEQKLRNTFITIEDEYGTIEYEYDENGDVDNDDGQYDHITNDNLNYMEGYTAFAFQDYYHVMSTIVKVKRITPGEGFNIRVYSVDIEPDDPHIVSKKYCELVENDSNYTTFLYQFNARRLFLGEDRNGCLCSNERSCKNRGKLLGLGPVTDEQFDVYTRIPFGWRFHLGIGDCMMAHVCDNIYIVLSSACKDFILRPQHEIVRYSTYQDGGSSSHGPRPFAIDSDGNYYLLGFETHSTYMKSKIGTICDPHGVYAEIEGREMSEEELRRNEHGIYDFDVTWGVSDVDELYDPENNIYEGKFDFITTSPDFILTFETDELGPKSAAKLS